MSNITERLKDAAKLYPIIEDQPYSLFVDSLVEIERLQARVASLECSLWGAEDSTNPDAFILRKQADSLLKEASMFGGVDFRGVRLRLSELAQGLRNEADNAEGADNAE